MRTSTTDPGAGQPPELPGWGRVGVLIAHPDDESFGLGALLAAFVAKGADVCVVCLTKGEASTLGDGADDLAALRREELARAAARLGVLRTHLLDFPDGGLTEVPLGDLVSAATSGLERPDGLLVFDVSGVTGHPDHVRATEAAVLLGRERGIPVLGWTIPAGVARVLHEETGAPFTGHPEEQIDLEVTVDREAQLAAVHEHASQAVPGSVLWRRLELLGDREFLRWLVRPSGVPPQ